MAERRKVDDRQSPVNQGHAGIRIAPDSAVVRPAMIEGGGHPIKQGRLDCSRCNEARYSAHAQSSPSVMVDAANTAPGNG